MNRNDSIASSNLNIYTKYFMNSTSLLVRYRRISSILVEHKYIQIYLNMYLTKKMYQNYLPVKNSAIYCFGELDLID